MILIQPSWVHDHKIHNPRNSRFLAIAEQQLPVFRLWASPIEIDGEIVSAAIFEEYLDDAAHWGSFLHDRKRYLFRCHGHIGIYTKPEFRKKGHAKKALGLMLPEIQKRAHSGVINLLAAQCTIHPRLRSMPWPEWAVMRAAIGRNLWEMSLKRTISREKSPPHVTSKQALDTLEERGYIRTQIDGRWRLYNKYEHPDAGTLERTETIRISPPCAKNPSTSTNEARSNAPLLVH